MLVPYTVISQGWVFDFSIFGVKLWNCLKPNLRKLKRKKTFQKKKSPILLAVLAQEGDYVDVLTFI